jgi:sulfite exporter TauE/SafE/copper chaperone CopZ
MSKNKELKCFTYKVNGMHCAACELLLEDKLSKLEGVEKVDAKLGAGIVDIYTSSSKSAEELASSLSKLIEKDGYSIDKKITNSNQFDEWFYALPISIVFILIYAILVREGILESGITGNSSILQIFTLGIIASLSSCMALVGGIALSISSTLDGQPLKKKYTYQFNFHAGRLIGFAVFGGLLGLIGGVLKPTFEISIFLTILVSAILLILGLSQIFPQSFTRFQLRLPKSVGRFVLNKNVFSPISSFWVGVLTFFVPCGFTNSVQVIALETGNFWSASVILFVFAVGTLPALALVSFASANLSERFNNGIFKKTTGILILTFAIYYLVLLVNRISV